MLALTRDERLEVNRIYTDRTVVSEVPGLKPIFPGNHVRVLNMTRKEQIQNKTKGFAPKWSRKIYTVRKKLPVAKNKTQFRYYMEENIHWYYRHELLRISGPVDTHVPQDLVRFKEVSIGDEYVPGLSDEEWEHD